MGGLSAARVLADFYETVTVVERDVLPRGRRTGGVSRRAGMVTPFSAEGWQCSSEFFPGFTDDLVDAGVPVLDYRDLSEMYMSFGGHVVTRNGGFVNVPPLYMPSRPLLESLVRQRLRAIRHVSILDGYDVVALTSECGRDDGSRVRGSKPTPVAENTF